MIGSFCSPIKEKNVLWYFSCFNTELFLGHVCYTERASSGGFSIKQLHSLPPGELTCFFWVLLLRDTAKMQIIVCVLLSLPLNLLSGLCCLFMSSFLTLLLYSNSILICLFEMIMPQFTILYKNSLLWHQFLISLTFATYNI